MAMFRHLQFFYAPHVESFPMEKYLGIMGAVDMGIYTNRHQLSVDGSKGIVFRMSFAY
jgi:hypothetical protein